MHKINTGEKPYRQEQDESVLIMKASNVSKKTPKKPKNKKKTTYTKLIYIISICIHYLINLNYDKNILFYCKYLLAIKQSSVLYLQLKWLTYTKSSQQQSNKKKSPWLLPQECLLFRHLLNSGGHTLCLLLSAIIDCVGVFQLVYLLLCLCAPSSRATTGFHRAPQLTILTG